MTRKILQKQCSNTSREFRPITVKRTSSTRTYTTNRKGGEMSLKMKVPPSKFAQKIRNIFFMIFERKK